MKNIAFVIRDSISTLTASYLCRQESYEQYFLETFGVDQTHQEEMVPFVKLANKPYINGKQTENLYTR